MLKFISKIFKKKQVEKPKGAYYPVDELNKVKDTYENKQLEKAMKAPIDQDRIRKAGW
jgi:hypothetical protein|tara:strand:+ start:1162 stop:1335 length:174 start_codon:yes stop_codon:yes gene_type:complete